MAGGPGAGGRATAALRHGDDLRRFRGRSSAALRSVSGLPASEEAASDPLSGGHPAAKVTGAAAAGGQSCTAAASRPRSLARLLPGGRLGGESAKVTGTDWDPSGIRLGGDPSRRRVAAVAGGHGPGAQVARPVPGASPRSRLVRPDPSSLGHGSRPGQWRCPLARRRHGRTTTLNLNARQ